MPDMLPKINEELKKQFDVGFLEVTKYPQWMTNIVSKSKKDGKVWIFVDYWDLNIASPKKIFLLLYIDTLVDNTLLNQFP